jgi:ADP-ribosyl-[dinitrogen reductase] hydrolase
MTIVTKGSKRDRARGALGGLAAGEAVGTTVEFQRPGSFPPLTDKVGGGPFGLAAGKWTDDTSMALCLAESLIDRRGHDGRAPWRGDGRPRSMGLR